LSKVYTVILCGFLRKNNRCVFGKMANLVVKEDVPMNNKAKGALAFLLILVLTAGFCFLGIHGANDIKLGLDLNGGVSITYQAEKENPTAEQMSDTVYKLQLKAQGYSTEAQVYQEGSNRVNIDIPGATDANAILAELGEPGTLQFADIQGNVLLTGDDVKNAVTVEDLYNNVIAKL
jgi:SecD/SecF fusion protein